MRLCICISGQIRGEHLALDQLKSEIESLSDDIEVTLIFSVWDKVSGKLDGELHLPQLYRMFEPEVAELFPSSFYGTNFWDNLPKTYNRLLQEDNTSVQKLLSNLFPDAIIDIEADSLNLEFSEPCADKNSVKMLYKVWRCNEIKKKIEAEQGTFDCVLRTRPDLLIKLNNSLIKERITNDIIYIPEFKASRHSHDIMAYGSSYVLDRYSELFPKSLLQKWSHIHQELFAHLESHTINERKPQSIKDQNIEKNKLLNFSDIIDDTPIISFLKMNYHLPPTVAISTITKLLKQDLPKDYKVSLYTLLSWKLAANDDFTASFHAFLSGNLSLKKTISFDQFSERVVAKRFCKYCSALELNTTQIINVFISPEIMTTQLKSNLDRLYKSKTVRKHLLCMTLDKAFLANDIETLKNVELVRGVPNHYATLYANKALELEDADIESAYTLMSFALRIHPRVELFIKKIAQYKAEVQRRDEQSRLLPTSANDSQSDEWTIQIKDT